MNYDANLFTVYAKSFMYNGICCLWTKSWQIIFKYFRLITSEFIKLRLLAYFNFIQFIYQRILELISMLGIKTMRMFTNQSVEDLWDSISQKSAKFGSKTIRRYTTWTSGAKTSKKLIQLINMARMVTYSSFFGDSFNSTCLSKQWSRYMYTEKHTDLC